MSIALFFLVVGGMLSDTVWLANSQVFRLTILAGFAASLLISISVKSTRPYPLVTLTPIVWGSLLWAELFLVNALRSAEATGTVDALVRLAPGVLWVMLLLTWKSSPIDKRLLASVAMTGISLVGLLTLITPEAWRACDIFKCGQFGGMLTGPYTSENYVSLLLTATTALYVVAYGYRSSLPQVTLAILWLLATESRTAQNALLAILAIAICYTLLSKAVKTDFWSGRFLWFAAYRVLPFAMIALAILLAMTATPSTFSNRGNIWISAVELTKQNPVFGWGIDQWEIFQAAGYVPSHYPHSTYLLIAFSGGAVAVAIFYFFISSSIRSHFRASDSSILNAVPAVAFMIVCLLEIAWNPLAIDGTSWIPLTLVALKLPSTREQPYGSSDQTLGALLDPR